VADNIHIPPFFVLYYSLFFRLLLLLAVADNIHIIATLFFTVLFIVLQAAFAASCV
jgi:hypothetical protein